MKMKTIKKLALLSAAALLSTGFIACSSEEEAPVNPTFDGETVKTAFTISLPGKFPATRQSESVAQAQASPTFRGFDDFYLVPFGTAINPSATGSDYGAETKNGSIITLSHLDAFDSYTGANIKVYSGQSVPVGTNHFLFYAKAQDENPNEALTTDEQKFQYGTLAVKTGATTGIVDASYTKAADITFSPVQINTSASSCGGSSKGTALIALLQSVADASGWKASGNTTLTALRSAFLSLKVGSSAGVRDALEDLYISLNSMASNSSNAGYSVAIAIRTAINAALATPLTVTAAAASIGDLSSTYTGYPADINLPDGAARVQWNGSSEEFEFIADQAHAAPTGVNALSSYVYPANLWYYVNSDLKTSNTIQSTNYGSLPWSQAGDDNDILDLYDGTVVAASTRSVAMTLPAQYAVGRLSSNVAALTSGTYYDKRGDAVVVDNGFTLTAVLVGGQKPVDWQFLPTGSTEYVVYDKTLNSVGSPNWTVKVGSSYASGTNYTLLLETAPATTVNVALEFVNNCADFQGADGIIPHGAKFYLLGQLDPANATNKATVTHNTVFKKDYNTTVTFTIAHGTDAGVGGLATATNGIPDLRTPSVELGLSVDLTWETGLNFNVEI